jgi:fengycin family lipopeptide synthetase D
LRESAVVAIQSDGFEGWLICCAYVLASDNVVSVENLRKDLARLLPSYMLPVRWTRLDALPKNANGKIDRPRLKNAFLVSESRQAQAEASPPHDASRADRMVSAAPGRG